MTDQYDEMLKKTAVQKRMEQMNSDLQNKSDQECIPKPKYITEYKERIWPKDLDLDPDDPQPNTGDVTEWDPRKWEDSDYFEFKTIKDRDKWLVWMHEYEDKLLANQRKEIVEEKYESKIGYTLLPERRKIKSEHEKEKK